MRRPTFGLFLNLGERLDRDHADVYRLALEQAELAERLDYTPGALARCSMVARGATSGEGRAMHTADECRAKAEERLAMAACSPLVADGYRPIAEELMNLARTAEWQDRFEVILEP